MVTHLDAQQSRYAVSEDTHLSMCFPFEIKSGIDDENKKINEYEDTSDPRTINITVKSRYRCEVLLD